MPFVRLCWRQDNRSIVRVLGVYRFVCWIVLFAVRYGNHSQISKMIEVCSCCCSVNIWHPSQRSYDLLLRTLLLSNGSCEGSSAFNFGSQPINLRSGDIVAFDFVTDSIVEVAVFVTFYVSHADAALWKEADLLFHEPQEAARACVFLFQDIFQDGHRVSLLSSYPTFCQIRIYVG